MKKNDSSLSRNPKYRLPSSVTDVELKTTRCSMCNCKQKYTNPITRCYECKKRFCFDHINALMYNNTVGANEEVRTICDSCAKLHNYLSL